MTTEEQKRERPLSPDERAAEIELRRAEEADAVMGSNLAAHMRGAGEAGPPVSPEAQKSVDALTRQFIERHPSKAHNMAEVVKAGKAVGQRWLEAKKNPLTDAEARRTFVDEVAAAVPSSLVSDMEEVQRRLGLTREEDE